jgi:lysophospholipase L1-like esterase
MQVRRKGQRLPLFRSGITTRRRVGGGGGGAPAFAFMPKVSQGRPTTGNNGFGGSFDPANATDADYNTQYRSVAIPSVGTPQWVAVDISNLTAGQKAAMFAHLRSDISTYPYYDTTVANVYTIPEDYKIQGNAAAGGGAAPGSGWVDIATVTGSFFTSRAFNLGSVASYNWIRVSCTKSHGGVSNDDAAYQLDLHNASDGIDDSFLALGTSITAEVFKANVPGGGAWTNGTLAQKVATLNASRFPLIVNGGIGGMTIATAYTNRVLYVNSFPGKHVILDYGTNDAAGGVTDTAFDTSLGQWITYLEGLGYTVILPRIPKRTDNASYDTLVQAYNVKIVARAVGSVKLGPDFWTLVNNGTVTLRDGLHPTTAGTVAMQQAWADWIHANLS